MQSNCITLLQPMTARTRVVILSGFLGAGKTTLLNTLLRQTTEPLGAIVNDFGDINVDAALVSGQVALDTEIALQGGCICCTIRDDLLLALLRLRRRPHPPRRVVIETSGVSDPAAVARTFVHPRVAPHVELAAIVGCVDPLSFSDLGDEDRSLAAGQLRVCDFVVLTKAELCSEAQLQATRSALQTIAPRARMLTASQRDAPTELLLDGPTLWNDARVLDTSEAFERPHVHALSEAPGHHHHDHHHHDGHAFETWSYESTAALGVDRLRATLANLPAGIFRAKGFVHLGEDPSARVEAHVVGARVELRVCGPMGGPPRTQLVFLAREGHLRPSALRASLDACAYDPEAVKAGPLEAFLGAFARTRHAAVAPP